MPRSVKRTCSGLTPSMRSLSGRASRAAGMATSRSPSRICVSAGVQAAAERQEVHGWRTDEIGNEQRRRSVIDIARARDLLDDAVVHHGDHVGHRHRLELVVRNVDRRRAEPVMQRAQFTDHRLAHFGIECAERLVHQETLRLAHDRPPERDALPVAAGKTRHRPVEKMRNAQYARGFHDPPVGSPPRRCPRISRESRCFAGHSCADRGRTAGTRRRYRAPRRGSSSRPRHRAGWCRPSAVQAPQSCAASSSCRSRRVRAGRGTGRPPP